MIESQLIELEKIWEQAGSLVESVSPGLRVYHSGHIPTMDQMDDERALWTTRSEDCKTHYVGSAREAVKWAKHAATLLTLEVSRELKAADFDSASLLAFTKSYCNYDHNQMKVAVRTWCIRNRFDAVVRLNSDPTEVVLVRPKSSLSLVHAQPL